jgi:DNA replication protein DnaC
MKNATLDLLNQMKLTGMAKAYEGILGLPVNKHPGSHELMANLTDAELQYRSQRKMVYNSLVIFDDFGLQAMTHTVKLIFLQILEDRYERAATLICSQLPVSKWYEFFDEPTLADAILDRITPKAHRIELKGKSLRKHAEHLS